MVGQYQELKKEIDAAIKNVLESGQYILGEQVQAFEQEFAAYIGVKYAVAVGSGTDALAIALWAAAIRTGDQVLLPSLTATATATAVKLVGAMPVFVDIDPFKMTVDPGEIERVITPEVKAVIPVHLYGRPAAIHQIMAETITRHIPVIEDCAQAHGASVNNHKVGSFANLGAFSFYPTKNLGAFGDGGMITTDFVSYYKICLELRQYGWSWYHKQTTYGHHGMNSRLDELQAAVLRVKLKYLDKWNDLRRRQAEIYFNNLPDEITLPEDHPQHVYHQYVIRYDKRDELLTYLLDNNIRAAVHYRIPCHLQPYYKTEVRLPVTEQVCREIISLPIGPHVSDDEIEQTIEHVRRFTRN